MHIEIAARKDLKKRLPVEINVAELFVNLIVDV